MAEPTTRLRLRVSPGAGAHGARRPARRRVEGARHRGARARARERRRRAAARRAPRTSRARRSPSFPATRSRDKVVELRRPRSAARQSGGWRQTMTTIDIDRFRSAAGGGAKRVEDAIENLHQENPGSLADETDEAPLPGQPHGRHRHRDASTARWRARSRTTRRTCSPRSTPRCSASTRGRTAMCERCGKPIDRGTPRGAPVGDALHRRQAKAGAG